MPVVYVCFFMLFYDKLDGAHAEFLISSHGRRYSHANQMKGQYLSQMKRNVWLSFIVSLRFYELLTTVVNHVYLQ